VRALMHRPVPGPPGRTGLEALEAEARKAEATIAAQLARLETRLAGRDFLCGAFSVADIAVFMVLLYGQRLGGPPLDPHPALSAWFRRLLARPAFARAVEESAEADRRLSRPVPGAWGGRGAPPTG
jgi:glutathione S-transferase